MLDYIIFFFLIHLSSFAPPNRLSCCKSTIASEATSGAQIHDGRFGLTVLVGIDYCSNEYLSRLTAFFLFLSLDSYYYPGE